MSLPTKANIEDIRKLLPELSDALEEIEIWGQTHSQAYRKLNDWYRKMLLLTKQG
jgi:hypothetical protein